MRTLILMRHGEAEAVADQPGAEGQTGDAARPLTAAGVATAERAAQSLAAAGLTPDVALVSPAVRTRQTWAAAAPSWPGVEPRWTAELQNAPALTVRGLLERTPAATVLAVGHNPTMHDLALRLAQEGGEPPPALRRGFPPGSAAVLERTEAGWRLAGLHGPVAA